ncbi:MAG TPA: hypothetical protein DD473_26355, partial [Planctomycetaceae bacterium]|nr:hypothetical protein [Planctomycetaceae bacterium]
NLLQQHRNIADNYSEILGREIQYVSYESGSHIFGFNSPFWQGPAEAAAVEAMYSPRMYDVYQTLLNVVRDIGLDLYNEFTFTSHYGASPYGSYGLLYAMDQPLDTAHQYNSLQDFIAAQAETQASVPVVTVHVDNSTGSESGTAATLLFSLSEAQSEDLTVYYSLAGSALVGADYTDPGNSIVILAGETSNTLVLQPVDDELAEGDENVLVELLADAAYSVGELAAAEVVITDNDFEVIQALQISHTLDVYEHVLPATLPDGVALSYSAELVITPEYLIDQQYNFHSTGNYHQNYHGQNERWIQGDGYDWFYLLNNGELFRWQDSFANSELIASLTADVYDDPQRLIDVEIPAVVSVVDNQLIITPSENFLGSFEIDVTIGDGSREETQRVMVSVINSPPIISPIANQQMSVTDNLLIVPLEYGDSDSEPVQLIAQIVGAERYELDQQFDFWSEGNYFENHQGGGERWLRSQTNQWFYLLENGDLHQWNGSLETSPLIAALGTAVYEDPTLLIDVESIPITLQMIGNELHIDPAETFAGEFMIEILATDGLNTTSVQFSVSVINQPPMMDLIPDQLLLAEQTESTLPLNFSDADGTPLQ